MRYETTKYSGAGLAKNSLYNLFGFVIPLLIAIWLLPFIIKGLGIERFGVFSLAIVFIGYFSLFDLGVGKAITKLIAEKIRSDEGERITELFWTAFFIVTLVSMIIAIITFLLLPIFIFNFFKISDELKTESLHSFYLLVVSIPIIATSASIRGVLEAYQAFKVISIIRIIIGIFTLLLPLLCLYFTKNLVLIIGVLVIFRIVIIGIYFNRAVRTCPLLKEKVVFNYGLVKEIFQLSGWMSISGIVAPIYVYLDRFVIGTIASAYAVAYYVTPYEIISKVLIIPTALAGVFFPMVAGSYKGNPQLIHKLLKRIIKYNLILLYPVVLIILTFAKEGLTIWIGEEFAKNSYIVAQILALGVLINSVGYALFAFLDGIGRPDINAKLQLAELPFFLMILFYFTQQWGINGTASAFVVHTIVNSGLLFYFVKRITGYRFIRKVGYEYFTIVLFIVLIFVGISFSLNMMLKLFLSAMILLFYFITTWKVYLVEDEKEYLLMNLKRLEKLLVYKK